MNKLKVMTVVGTRPEIIRLSEVIKKCDEFFDHILVHTGQNYDKNLKDIFFEDLGLRQPDFYLDSPGKDLGETMGNIIARTYELMVKEQPEALLVLGDTNSALCALSAKRLKIPIFHMEAGNRCFDENLPEETNRRIVDHISDINLTYTEHARRYLISEGVKKEHIFVTGSPMREVINAHKEEIKASNVLKRLSLKKGKYIVLSAHREENIDNEKHFESLCKSIEELARHYEMPVIYSVHPRSAKRIKEKGIVFSSNVWEMEPFNFTDYSALMLNSYCVVSDSGTIPEEAAVEKFPAVVIRTSTERPEAVETGSFILGGIEEKDIIRSVDMAVKFAEQKDFGSEVRDYSRADVSSAVVRMIQSYTHVVNDKVWRK